MEDNSLWIPLHHSLCNNRKLKKFITELDTNTPTAIGYLVLLWLDCLDHAQDGDVTKYSLQDMADICEYTDRPDKLYDALIKYGWLDKEGGRVKVHDWDYYYRFSKKQKHNEYMKDYRANHKKKDTTEEPNIFKDYEANIGMLTPMVSEKIKDALDTYPNDWIPLAIKEAATHNARNWNYIEACLKNWEAKGTPSSKPKEAQNERKYLD